MIIKHFVERMRELSRDTESGAATVEFVLIFPIQLMLTLMIIQFAFISHAQIVVTQAAFMGARAAAVADGYAPGNAPGGAAGNIRQAAALRVVARTVGVLTSGEPPDGAFTQPAVLTGSPLRTQTRLSWPGDDQGGRALSTAREQEAYAHLTAGAGGSTAQVTIHDGTTNPNQGFIACEVHYDYVMGIPLANRVFAGVGGILFGGHQMNQTASLARNRPVFTLKRTGYCPTPWTQGGGGSGAMAPGINVPNPNPNGPP